MDEVCFSVGGITVHWYGVMMALGFLAGLANWTWLGRRRGKSFNYASDLLFWIMVAGVLGARAAYVVANWRAFLESPLAIVKVWQGGLIFYGGFFGGCMAVILFARAHHEHMLDAWDFAVTAVPLGHAFGRVGCFLNGCCHGRIYHGLLAVTYPRGSLPWALQVDAGKIDSYRPRSLPVHPVQLYEAALNLCLYGVLVWLFRRRLKAGTVCAVYFLGYPVIRFTLEFLRGDPRAHWGGLTVAQALSIAFFLFGVGVLVVSRVCKNRPADTVDRP